MSTEAEQKRKDENLKRLRTLYDGLTIIIEKYLMHELPGQKKSIFGPSHSKDVKRLKGKLDEIMALSQGYTPQKRIDKIMREIEFYQNPNATRVRLGSSSDVNKYSKGGESFGKAIGSLLSKDLVNIKDIEAEINKDAMPVRKGYK